jgi:hypothetical protein
VEVYAIASLPDWDNLKLKIELSLLGERANL